MRWRKSSPRRFYSLLNLLWIGFVLNDGCHSGHPTNTVLPTPDTIRSSYAPKSIDWVQATAQLRKEIAHQIRPAVYRVVVQVRYKYRTDRYNGTGWVADNGYVWTCSHLFPQDGAFKVEIWDHMGQRREGRLVWRDPTVDAALLQIDTLPLLRLSMKLDSFPEVGETVYSLGAPMGLLGTLQEGFVAAEIRHFQSTGDKTSPFLQLSLPAQPGSSGSPVIDRHGRVVGMISDIASVSGEYEGISFAIPAQVLSQVWERYRSFASNDTQRYRSIRQ